MARISRKLRLVATFTLLWACTPAMPDADNYLDTNPWGAKPCTVAKDCPAVGLGPCDIAACEGFVCQKVRADDGASCLDDDPCTAGNTCIAGTCVAGKKRLFDRTYGGPKIDVGADVIALADGNMVVGAITQSTTNGQDSERIAWLDEKGDETRVVTRLNKEAARLNVLIPTKDGGFAGGGRIMSGKRQPRVVRLQSDGTLLWEKTYTDWNYERGVVYDMVQVADQGFFCVGENQQRMDNALQNENGWLMRVTSAGQATMQRSIPLAPVKGKKGRDRLLAVAALGNTHMVAAGSTTGFTKDVAQGWDGWLIKVAADGGQSLWEKALGGTGTDKLLDVQVVDGAIHAAGVHDQEGAQKGWLVKLDSDGNVLWDRKYGAKWFFVRLVAVDSGLLAVGDDRSGGSMDGLVARLGSNGDVAWSRTFGGEGHDGLFGAAVLPDGFALVGETGSKGNGSHDVWLLRTDRWGNLDCDKRCLRDRAKRASCDDGDPCTADSCDPVNGSCRHDKLTSACAPS